MRLKTYRRTSQVVFTLLTITGLLGVSTTGIVYPYFFCYACPFDVGACPLGILEHGAIDVQLLGLYAGLSVLLFLFGFLSLLALFFGRAFCGWACPMGLLQDGTGKLGIHKQVKKGLGIEEISPAYRYVKYVILVLIPVLSYVFLDLVYTRFCPIGGVTGTLPALLFSGSDWQPSTWFAVKVVSIALFSILIILVGRGWCKYLCPVGAYLAPWNKVSALAIKRTPEDCTECGLCERKCPMNINNIGNKPDSECILCGRCVDNCKHKSLKLGTRLSKKNVKLVAIWATALGITVSLFAVGIWGGGYGRADDINDIPCLGCLALDPTGSAEFRPLGASAVHDFIATNLSVSPVFLHYRTDVCPACDEMEPTIRELESEYGSVVKFVHINLDHATEEQDASYDVYDVKGTTGRTGVPMFVVLSLDVQTGEPAYATSYGIQPKEALVAGINEGRSMHPGQAAASRSIVFTELFVDMQCTYCPNSEKELEVLAAAGKTAFLTYVSDAPGETGVIAREREARYKAALASGGAHPWVVFAGGPVERMGGSPDTVQLYETDLASARIEPAELSVEATLGDSSQRLNAIVSVENLEPSQQALFVEVFLVEQRSRWNNLLGEPIPFAFVDVIANGTYTLASGERANIDVNWTGTDVLSYSNMRLANTAIVTTVWKGGVQVYAGVTTPDVQDDLQIILDSERKGALPNGSAQFELTIYNRRPSSVQLAASSETAEGWTLEISQSTVDIPPNANRTIALTATGLNTTIGDVARFGVVLRGTVDQTLYLRMGPEVVVKEDVTEPQIASATSSPDRPSAGETITVRAVVGDDTSLSSVRVSYFSCTDEYCSATYLVNMTLVGNSYVADITALGADHTSLHYKIIAEDNYGNVNISDIHDVLLAPEESLYVPPDWAYAAVAMLVAAIIVAVVVITTGRRKR